MKKSFIRIITIILLLVCFIFGTIFAANNSVDASTTYTYTYDGTMPEGWNTEYTAQTKLPDTLPIPTRDGYSFKGWFTDNTYSNSALAGSSINSDTTLYAKWAKIYTYGTKGTDEYLEFDIPLDSTFTGGALTTGNYYFDDDITLAEQITIGSNQTVNILFNGHVLDLKNVSSNEAIKSSGNLGLYDQHKGVEDNSYSHMFGVVDGLAVLNEETVKQDQICVYGGVITGRVCDGKYECLIYCNDGTVTIKGITFVGNKSTFGEIGLYTTDITKIVIDNISFTYNLILDDTSTDTSGSFITIAETNNPSCPIAFNNVTFNNNTVKRNTLLSDEGPFLYIGSSKLRSLDNQTTITFENIDVSNNNINGQQLYGLFYIASTSIIIKNSTFDNNSITCEKNDGSIPSFVFGGLIYTKRLIKFINTKFTNNSVSSEQNIQGGLIDSYCYTSETSQGVFFDNCLIDSNSISQLSSDSNTSLWGGLIYSYSIDKTAVTITNNTKITNNTINSKSDAAGGIIYSLSSPVIITDSNIQNNSINFKSMAGGIVYALNKLEIKGSANNYVEISNNKYNDVDSSNIKKGSYSGLLFFITDGLDIKYTNINDNSVKYKISSMTNGLFINARNALTSTDYKMNFDSVNIKNNTTTNAGGEDCFTNGIFIYTYFETTLKDVLFDTNTFETSGSFYGGIFYSPDLSTTFTNVDINKTTITIPESLENTHSVNGGLIYSNTLSLDTNSSITKSNISGNTYYYGGLIFCRGTLESYATIDENTVTCTLDSVSYVTKGGLIFTYELQTLKGSITNNTIDSKVYVNGGLVCNEGNTQTPIDSLINSLTCNKNTVKVVSNTADYNVKGGIIYLSTNTVISNSTFNENKVDIITKCIYYDSNDSYNPYLKYLAPFIYGNKNLEIESVTINDNDIDLKLNYEYDDKVDKATGLVTCKNLKLYSSAYKNNDISLDKMDIYGGIIMAEYKISVYPSENLIIFDNNNIHSLADNNTAIYGGIIYANDCDMNETKYQTKFINNKVQANNSELLGGIIRLCTDLELTSSYMFNSLFDKNIISNKNGDIVGGILFNSPSNGRILIRDFVITNNTFKDNYNRTSNNDEEESTFTGTISSSNIISLNNIKMNSNTYSNFTNVESVAINVFNKQLTIDTFEFNNNTIDVLKSRALLIKLYDNNNVSKETSLDNITVKNNIYLTHTSYGTIYTSESTCFIYLYTSSSAHKISIADLDVEDNNINITGKFGGFINLNDKVTIDGYKLINNTIVSQSTTGFIFNDYNSTGFINTLKNVLVKKNSFTSKGLSHNVIFNSESDTDLISFEILENTFVIEYSRDNDTSYNLFKISYKADLKDFKFNDNDITVTINNNQSTTGNSIIYNSVNTIFRFERDISIDNCEFNSNTFDLYTLNRYFIYLGKYASYNSDTNLITNIKDLCIYDNEITTTAKDPDFKPAAIYIASADYNKKVIAELSGKITVKSNTIDDKLMGLSTSLDYSIGSYIKYNNESQLSSDSYIDIQFTEFEDDYSSQLLFINGKDYINNIHIVDDRFYKLLDGDDILYSGRIKEDPTSLTKKYIVYIDDLIIDGYQSTYKWFKGNNEILNQSTYEYTSTSYVFGTFKCVLTLEKAGEDSIIFNSKAFSLAPKIINNPSESNEYFFDVDLSKIEEAGVTVDYEWYKEGEDKNADIQKIDNDLVTTYSTKTDIYYLHYDYDDRKYETYNYSIQSKYDSVKGCYIGIDEDIIGISITLNKGDLVLFGAYYPSPVMVYCGVGTSEDPLSEITTGYIYAQEAGTYWIFASSESEGIYVYTCSFTYDDELEIVTYDNGERFDLPISDDPLDISSVYDSATSMYYAANLGDIFGVTLNLSKNDLLVIEAEESESFYCILELVNLEDEVPGIYYAFMNVPRYEFFVPITKEGNYLLLVCYMNGEEDFNNPGISINVTHQGDVECILSEEPASSQVPITSKINDKGIIESTNDESYVGFDIYLEENDALLINYYDYFGFGYIAAFYSDTQYTCDSSNLILYYYSSLNMFVAQKTGYYTFLALEGEESIFDAQSMSVIKLGAAKYEKINLTSSKLFNQSSGKYYAKAIYHQGDETFTLKSKAFEYTKQNRIFDINSNNDNEEEKPIIKCSSNTGFSEDVIVTVEVTLEAEVKEAELTIDYYNVNSGLAKLNSNEKIGVVYDVKLLRNGVVIQPSDLGENTVIKVRMLIPDTVDINKVTRLIHVHNKNEIHSYAFDKTKVDSEGYYEIDLMKFSEFAFVYEVETPTNKKSELLQIILVILLIILSLVLINTILYVTWKYSVLKTKDDTIFDRYFRFMDKGYVKFCKLFTKKEKLFTRLNTLEEQRLNI